MRKGISKSNTKNKAIGTKFEVWAEQLFSDLGYNVRRNIVYHNGSKKKGSTYRQVDLELFEKVLGLIPKHTILELKYSSRGKIRLNHRSVRPNKKKSERTIDNLVSELDERRRFIGANYAILVTNQEFTDEVRKEAECYGIALYDRRKLKDMDNKRASFLERIGVRERPALEKQVARIRFNKEHTKPEYRKVGKRK